MLKIRTYVQEGFFEAEGGKINPSSRLKWVKNTSKASLTLETLIGF